MFESAHEARAILTITQDLPHLPDFSEFDIAFRPVEACGFGDMRSAFYAGYEESDREYVQLGSAGRRIAEGRKLVSTTFVVPYPPGGTTDILGRTASGCFGKARIDGAWRGIGDALNTD